MMGGIQSLATREVDVEEYIATARTGDVILWSSSGFEATMVKLFSDSYYSHIGIVLVLDTPLHPGESGKYFFHSPSGPVRSLKDCLSEPPVSKEGPQMNDLVTVLDRCRGAKSIEIRRMHMDSTVQHPWADGVLTTSTSSTLRFAEHEHTKLYEQDKLELFRAACTFFGENERDLSSYFCSELVAETFIRAKLLNTALPSNAFTPKHFSTADRRKAPFVAGVTLGPEERIVYASRARLTAAYAPPHPGAEASATVGASYSQSAALPQVGHDGTTAYLTL